MRKLIPLLLMSIVLSGCLLGGSGPQIGYVVLRTQPTASSVNAASVEVLFTTMAEEQYLYYEPTGGEIKETLPLDAGFWKISALWRDAEGNILAAAPEVMTEIRQGKTITFTLLQVPLPEIPQSYPAVTSGVKGSARNGQVTLEWPGFEEVLAGEIFRKSPGQVLWKRIALTDPGQTTLQDKHPAVGESNSYIIRVHHHLYPGPIGEVFSLLVPEPWANLTGSITVQYELPLPPEMVNVEGLGQQRVQLQSTALQDNSDELVIVFPDSTAFAQRQPLLAEAGLVFLDEVPDILAVVASPESGVTPNLNGLYEIGCLIEPHGRVVPQGIVPNDPYYEEQWNLALSSVPAAWEVTRGSRGIRIAVIDTGVDGTHPDLKGRIDTKTSYSFVDDSPLTDSPGHGTHVAGIIGALADNKQGIAGIMWDVTLVPIKVFRGWGGATASDVAKAILYAAGLSTNPKNPNPVDVINLSLGGPADDLAMRLAVEKVAKETDILLVAAAGNDGLAEVYYPAAYEEVIAVGAAAYDQDGRVVRASYSHTGDGIDILAPGGTSERLIISTERLGRSEYTYRYGTSMAAPHVAGVLGLMLSAGISPADARQILTQSAVDLGSSGWDHETGHGLLNANFAVRGINSVQIIVGERQGSHIIKKAQTEVPLGESLTGLKVPYGVHQVFALIDLGTPGVIDDADYLFESEPILFEEGDTIELEMVLKLASKIGQ